VPSWCGRNELAQQEEQMVVRDDMLKRTTLTSPVRGLVKNIRMNTLGGVVSAGAPVMEIVPVGDQVLVELRIKPADIGFVRVGQPVEIKLSAYDYTRLWQPHGTVDTLSPDAMGEGTNPATARRPAGTVRWCVPTPPAAGRPASTDGAARHGGHGRDPHRPAHVC
jgi:adhesin transport system membrane fusion protein